MADTETLETKGVGQQGIQSLTRCTSPRSVTEGLSAACKSTTTDVEQGESRELIAEGQEKGAPTLKGEVRRASTMKSKSKKR
jgi:hypothetical protein